MKTRLDPLDGRLHNSPMPEEVRQQVAIIKKRPLTSQASHVTLTLLACFIFALFASAAEVMPLKPKQHFNDYANVVSASMAEQINKTLEDFERATSNQLVIAIFPKMQSDSSIEDYATRVFNSWGVSQKDKDNGMALFVFQENRKLQIVTGKGLEVALPDALCKKIIENVIVPHFRSGNFEVGLTEGVRAIIAALTGQAYRSVYEEQQRQAEQKKEAEIAARSAAFVKANGVVHFVTIQQLAANPFVYQDQVVAIYGEFQQMNSATEGLFSVRDKSFIVSGIPKGKFTLPRSMVMLAGRVLGNIEIKLPLLGATLVPHLSFVGSAFCQEAGCSDYDIQLK